MKKFMFFLVAVAAMILFNGKIKDWIMSVYFERIQHMDDDFEVESDHVPTYPLS